MFALGLIASLATLSGLPLAATTYFEVKHVCPIGGEKFTAQEVGSNSTFGQRPDGKPYSPLPVVPYVECPSNGFPIFQEKFSNDDIAVLTPAVASSEYQSSRSSETQHYRVWMLQKVVGAKPGALASTLMAAAWETDGNGPRKIRYQKQFVAAVADLDRSADEEAWFWLNLRAGNALRELGQFEDAGARLDLVASNLGVLEDAELRPQVAAFIDILKQLVAEGNSASEPVGAVPDDVAAFRCVIEQSSLSPSEVTICRSESMITTIEAFETESDQGPLKGAEAVREMHRRFDQASEAQ